MDDPRQPTVPDPTLVEILTDGVDDPFVEGRQTAREYLEDPDVLAFSVQAIGDGSRLAQAPEGASEPQTYHQTAHLAGYHDDLAYPQVAQLARQLYAHQLGVFTNHTLPGTDPETVCREFVDGIVDWVQQAYPRYDPEAQPYPEPVGLADRIDQATTLLADPPLTQYWVQVLGESEGQIVQVDGSADSESSDGVKTFQDHPIRYIHGTLPTLQVDTKQALVNELLTQRLLVGAGTAGVAIESFAEECLEIAIECGYQYETIDPLA
ncbi:hypothetical protein ACFPYI_08595 [Halomarina salina]|uniref:Uncharacterized protein n=1 Tax=Halomarina salina TaxID=1872699 RepID=A0ABD5RM59_9EURY|nr:hypothetical protein [Halomarina salina]